jgi:hypothetical protein
LGASEDDDLSTLIPRGFVHGILAVMIPSIAFTLTA